MLNYFKINDPYRLILIAIMLLLIRIPFYIYGDVMMESDIRHLILGEKVASGFWVYSEIYTTESILSSLMYGMIHLLFGKSLVIYHVFGYLFTLIQVFLFNQLVNNNRVSLSQSYFPGLFYALFISVFPENYTLSPILVTQTLLLISLNYQFNHLEFRVKKDEKIILIGIFLGLASLLIGAASVYIITAYLIFILYTNTLTRRYFLMGFGFLLPLMLVWCAYVIRGEGMVFLQAISLSMDSHVIIEKEFWYLIALPAFYYILFLPSSLFGRRFTNYQTVLNQTVFIWFISSVLVVWLSYESPFQSFTLMVPILALYASHFFISYAGRLKAILFGILLVGIICQNYLEWNKPEVLEQYLGERGIEKSVYSEMTSGKRILVLGDDMVEYTDASHSTMFFDWEISKSFFNPPIDYFKLAGVYEGMKNDLPDIIIDPQQLMPPFFSGIPELGEKYRRENELWIKISN